MSIYLAPGTTRAALCLFHKLVEHRDFRGKSLSISSSDGDKGELIAKCTNVPLFRKRVKFNEELKRQLKLHNIDGGLESFHFEYNNGTNNNVTISELTEVLLDYNRFWKNKFELQFVPIAANKCVVDCTSFVKPREKTIDELIAGLDIKAKEAEEERDSDEEF